MPFFYPFSLNISYHYLYLYFITSDICTASPFQCFFISKSWTSDFLKCEILGDKSRIPRNHCSLPSTRNWPQIGLRWTDVKMTISFSIGIMRKITVKNQNLGMMPWPTFCNLETLRGVIFSWQTNIPLHPAACQKIYIWTCWGK